jgi:DNA-binding XRE family transcriptional regulator
MSAKEKFVTLGELEKELVKIPGMKEAMAEERAALRAARFVRETREAAELSQAKLATRLGVSQARVSEIEKGAGTYGVSVELLERIAIACGGTLGFTFAKAK